MIALLLLGAVLGLAAGCGSDPSTGAAGPEGVGTSSTITGTVTVFAAASLTGAFEQAAEAFEAANPDAEVTLNFAASSALAQQINQGAPADVFASADQANMHKVVDAGNIADKITERLGGQGGVDSVEGVGSTSYFTLQPAPQIKTKTSGAKW